MKNQEIASQIDSQSAFIQYIRNNSVGGRNLSIRGLAELCGVADTSIIRTGAFASEELFQKLTASGFKAAALLMGGFCARSAFIVIEYFAYDSKAKAIGAKHLAQLFGSVGVQTCFDMAHQPITLAKFQLPQTYLEALKALVISEETKEQEKLLRLAAEEQKQLLAAQIETDRDATNHGNAVAIASNCRDVGSFGKSLATPIGRTKMFTLLRELGFIMAKSALPYQKHIDNGNMLVIQVVTELSYGKTRTDSKCLITGKGELAIVKAMEKRERKEMVICQMERELVMID
jgi:phage antirepressor YoqD-like protein